MFQLSRTVGAAPQNGAEVATGFSAGKRAEKPISSQPVPLESLPPLSEEQKQWAALMTSGLDGELREAAVKAMEASLRRSQRELEG